MGYMHYDLGGLAKGKVIEVILQGNTANVYLMDAENFHKYSNGFPFNALGGLMTFSPIRLMTIDNGHWHLVMDLPHGKGTVKTSYRFTATKAANISTKLALFRPTEAQKKAILAMKGISAESPASPAVSIPSAPAATVAAASAASAKPEQVTCNKCGILTIRGKFCMDCGSPMENTCPGCSVINPMMCKFCPECGYRY
ncbi:MAG: DUF1883 domain-containing protein [Clostridiales bacterium]|jgi:hypothetical protein|nr:DUF1883 domain-containing protein [Clostridiales bacterium]